MAKKAWGGNCDTFARRIIQEAQSHIFNAKSYETGLRFYALLYTKPGEEPLKRIQQIIADEQMTPEKAKDHATLRNLEDVQKIIVAMLETH